MKVLKTKLREIWLAVQLKQLFVFFTFMFHILAEPRRETLVQLRAQGHHRAGC